MKLPGSSQGNLPGNLAGPPGKLSGTLPGNLPGTSQQTTPIYQYLSGVLTPDNSPLAARISPYYA